MENVTIKRGDSFNFSAAITDDSDVAISGIASKLKCQIRDLDGNLITEMTITEGGTAGTYIFRSGDTSNWAADEKLYCDIQYTDADGIIASTETFGITVREDVTRS